MHRADSRNRVRVGAALGGFTLIELLVVIAIAAALLGVLLPVLSGTISAARKFRCQVSLRSVAFDFSIFADEGLHGGRGDDEALGANRFTVETFQESQYAIDEFWNWGDDGEMVLPDEAGTDPMRCPEVPGYLTLRSNSPCSSGGVSPPENVSFAFNLRLHREEVEVRPGVFGLRRVVLSPSVIEYAEMPLLLDSDGEKAQRMGVPSMYMAPSRGSDGPLRDDRYWFPSGRHGGATNVAFIDGHVLSTDDPGSLKRWTPPGPLGGP